MPSKAHTIGCDSGSPGSVASESEIAAISPGDVADIGQLEYSWDPNETGLDNKLWLMMVWSCMGFDVP